MRAEYSFWFYLKKKIEIENHFRHQLTVWLCAGPLLYFIMNWSTRISHDPFLVLLFAAYTLLSYISYNLDFVRGEAQTQNQTVHYRYQRMLFYTFYPPYMISLIVPYSDFEKQIADRDKRVRNWRWILFFAARILFWWGFIDFMLHFSYHEALLFDTTYANTIPKDQFVSLGMALGTCNSFFSFTFK